MVKVLLYLLLQERGRRSTALKHRPTAGLRPRTVLCTTKPGTFQISAVAVAASMETAREGICQSPSPLVFVVPGGQSFVEFFCPSRALSPVLFPSTFAFPHNLWSAGSALHPRRPSSDLTAIEQCSSVWRRWTPTRLMKGTRDAGSA